MSWYVEFYAKSKEAAVSYVRQNQHMPAGAKPQLELAIGALPSNEGTVIHVKSQGHIDHLHGSIEQNVNAIPLVSPA
jgi:hypothetical protein